MREKLSPWGAHQLRVLWLRKIRKIRVGGAGKRKEVVDFHADTHLKFSQVKAEADKVNYWLQPPVWCIWYLRSSASGCAGGDPRGKIMTVKFRKNQKNACWMWTAKPENTFWLNEISAQVTDAETLVDAVGEQCELQEELHRKTIAALGIIKCEEKSCGFPASRTVTLLSAHLPQQMSC